MQWRSVEIFTDDIRRNVLATISLIQWAVLRDDGSKPADNFLRN